MFFSNSYTKTENGFTSEGKEFTSFSDMVKEKGSVDYYSSDSFCTDGYYHCGHPFVYTSGVRSFCEEYECHWLLDVVGSYIMEVSTRYCHVDGNGHIEYRDNPKGKDDILFCHLIRTGENKAVFTIDMEVHEGDYCYNKTIVYQEIEYTDIKAEAVEFYLEYGVLICPTEH